MVIKIFTIQWTMYVVFCINIYMMRNFLKKIRKLDHLYCETFGTFECNYIVISKVLQKYFCSLHFTKYTLF